MMQPAKVFDCIGDADVSNLPSDWRILLQRKMSSRIIIILHIRSHYSTEMRFAEDENVIETFAPNCPVNPL